MYRKIFVAIVTAVLLVTVVSAGCLGSLSPTTSQSAKTADDEITETVINTFEKLTHIPRPSHHEEQISAYLENWAKKNGFDVIRDKENNLIIDVSATPGMEDRPKVALQGHMDMVFAAADGLHLDPLTTRVKMVRHDSTVTSDGTTSLGADDGIGLAIMMCTAEGKMSHGPLRLIMTTNEEDGSTGVNALDKSHIQDINYLINIDSEREGEVTISSAARCVVYFSDTYTPVKPAGDTAVTISLSGLTSGHSGTDIDKGRLNAIIGLGSILDTVSGSVDFELQQFKGGSASNAIPSAASTVIVIKESDFETVEKICSTAYEELKSKHEKTDPEMKFSIEKSSGLHDVMPDDKKENLLKLVRKMNDGVHTWSPYLEGLVESSGNLGPLDANAEGMTAVSDVRGSVQDKVEELVSDRQELAKECNMNADVVITANPWPYNPDSRLLKTTQESYKKLFGKEIKVVALNAGLECGAFYIYNPNLDMIAIGPTIHNPHSIKETLETDSIAKVWRLLEDILGSIDNKQNETSTIG